ncbi:MAG: chromosome segregation protein SMC, partial [Mesorhizobium sp.]
EEAGRIRARQSELERRLQQLDGDIAREERMVRDNADILERLRTEEAALNSENAGAAEREATTRAAFEQAASTLSQSEAKLAALTAERSEAEQSVIDARATESSARPPLQDARAELARIETEARTLAKILNAASGDLFPAVLEQISVDRGFETALGAALGEDLDVPLDRSAPVHWGESAIQPGDAALPEGVKSLASVVHAPA